MEWYAIVLIIAIIILAIVIIVPMLISRFRGNEYSFDTSKEYNYTNVEKTIPAKNGSGMISTNIGRYIGGNEENFNNYSNNK